MVSLGNKEKYEKNMFVSQANRQMVLMVGIMICGTQVFAPHL